jgi:RimJ/RimL family protein N-acetyltransferase
VSAAPTLSGSGVVLRALTLADAPALFVAMSDPEVQHYRRDAAHADVEQTRRYIEDTLTRSCAAWAITEDGGEALGRLALRNPEPSVGEIGVVIRRAAQRRGLGGKAIRLVEAHAFAALGFDRLRADIDAENAPSKALFCGAGYRHERTARRAGHLGARDSVILVKLRAR